MTLTTNQLTIGILAHVDAGKTTLAEGILYLTGAIRKLGRVDHRDAFLDTYSLERDRGITIFSKQARLTLGEKEVTLLDTPGHVDFSAEMERTLQVLDYAILVISGADGVQGHVETLWRLLKRYRIPVFLFVNKMDQEGTDKDKLLVELRKRLDERCVDFSAGYPGDSTEGDTIEKQEMQELLWDNLAMCDEQLMEEYLENGCLKIESIARAIGERQVFPCYFGSALKLTGVEEFLQGIQRFIGKQEYPAQFGARVFKIGRDAQGSRLTYFKITGGSLRVKTLLSGKSTGAEGTEEWQEKVDQIRLYNGSSFQLTEEVSAGMICAVTGLSKTWCGQGIGGEKEAEMPLLEPVLTYQILLPVDCDVHRMLGQLRQLEEEEPELHIVWKEAVSEIHVQVMGEVQMEILQSLIKERFGVIVEFSSGSIVYKETIAAPVEGIGHFEPLRHYAEVHLLLEPGEQGSGMQFGVNCSEDELDRNWQRLVLTHLEEKLHKGVLTGSEITDMRITLVAGRAHLKHTEGGDFRQATYRAVRQGLKKAESVLLEPVYAFTLEVPTEMVGRAMTDIQKMQGSFEPPRMEGEMSVLCGSAPVVTMRGYQKEVTSYTRGRGRLACNLKGYEPCHNAEEVISAIGYDSEGDLENPTGSVFCAHGAGFVVPWDKVEEYAHVESGLDWKVDKEEEEPIPFTFRETSGNYITQEEIEEIFTRTYGTSKREKERFNRGRHTVYGSQSDVGVRRGGSSSKGSSPTEEYLLVDGYNIIFAWEDLRELAQTNIESARGKLMDILCNYQGWLKNTLIVVFDAYKVKGNPGTVEKYHNIHVVYTKEAETADQYIEKTVHAIGRKYHVTVATSDALEQLIIWGQGAARLSALGLKEAIEAMNREQAEDYHSQNRGSKNYPFRELLGENPGKE